jgi:hypothetical protein
MPLWRSLASGFELLADDVGRRQFDGGGGAAHMRYSEAARGRRRAEPLLILRRQLGERLRMQRSPSSSTVGPDLGIVRPVSASAPSVLFGGRAAGWFLVPHPPSNPLRWS